MTIIIEGFFPAEEPEKGGAGIKLFWGLSGS
jgi:hypothetical protein